MDTLGYTAKKITTIDRENISTLKRKPTKVTLTPKNISHFRTIASVKTLENREQTVAKNTHLDNPRIYVQHRSLLLGRNYKSQHAMLPDKACKSKYFCNRWR